MKIIKKLHLEHLGFDDKIEGVLQEATELGKTVLARHGKYVKYSGTSGLELWIVLDNEDKIIGVHPHYEGKSERNVNITKTLNENANQVTGAYYFESTSSDKTNYSGETLTITMPTPLVCDVPNFYMESNYSMSGKTRINLVAFPRKITVYENERAFKLSDIHTKAGISSNALIPIGLFDSNGKNRTRPLPLGLLTGFVKDAEIRTNEFTGTQFYAILAETVGGDFEIIVEKSFLSELPKKNSIVEGEFVFSGKPIEEPLKQTQKKSFFQKIFGV